MAAAITEILTAISASSIATFTPAGTISASVAVGDLIIVLAQSGSTDTLSATSIKDAADGSTFGSNTYTLPVQTVQNSASRAGIWYSVATVALASGTAKFQLGTVGASRKSILVWKLTPATTISQDKSASSTNQATTTSPVTGTTAATTQAEELVVGIWHYADLVTPPTFTAPSGWSQTTTAQQLTSGALLVNLSAAYKFVNATGTQAGTATLGSTQTAGGAIATFKYHNAYRNPAVNFQDPALMMQRFRQRILQRGRIFVPDLWLPEPCL